MTCSESFAVRSSTAAGSLMRLQLLAVAALLPALAIAADVQARPTRFILQCAPGSAASQPWPLQVTCGSLIKLAHESTKANLHSHDIAYGTGSGQQSVTGNADLGDANSMWVVRGPKVSCCKVLQG